MRVIIRYRGEEQADRTVEPRVLELPIAITMPRTLVAAPRSRDKVTREELAQLLATVLAPVAALAAALALWRLGQDVGFATRFFITEGALSHWQVWFGLAALLLAGVSRLNRIGKASGRQRATG
jgi:hypothetical protein